MPDNITEEVKDPGEELITPENVDEKLDDETPDDEKETPTASSAEDKPDDEKTEEDAEKPEGAPEGEAEESEEEAVVEPVVPLVGTKEEVKVEPKEVPGETPKEHALRLETARVKALLRKERGQKLIGDAPIQSPSSAELSVEDKKVLEGFDPEQVANQEKLFAILAKKQGYVRKDEFSKQTYTETAQGLLDDFLEKHDEYSAEKDPEGLLWNRFKQEYSIYNKPANPKDFVKIFNRVHNEIFGITTTPKQTPGQIAAKQEKVKTASHGAATATPSRLSDKRKTGPVDAVLSKTARTGGLKGFTDAEIAEMGL